ncbi:MAG: hypothetical protein A2X49_04185 [Lentisphaerae bacterium GWF2_52_8]|nr:MAG: hypothetical protein A2X49_04185 [Lentisphaerae bacterium GWF2_52_8]
MADRRKAIIGDIGSIKSVPASALHAMRLLQDQNSNMGAIVQSINYDPGMTSNILRLANSSYFGCSRAIASLRDAIVMLGSGNILKLVTAAVANAALNTKVRGYNITSQELWDHAVAVAVASENLSDLLKLKITRNGFTAGLLHDIGKVVMGRHIDKLDAKKMEEELKSGKPLVQIERDILGIDHGELGGILLSSWNIPEALVQAVRWHHEPQSCPDAENVVPALINMSDSFCLLNNIGTSEKQPSAPVNKELIDKLNVTDAVRDEVILRTKDSFENIKDIFSKRP